MADNRPNIIYFNPDEMRADCLGCYGHSLVKTPNFDRLANEGVRFDQCHVQHTVCSPSRCAVATGWYPHTHGHRTLWHLLQPHEPNTYKYLKDAGYDVHWIGGNDTFGPETLEQSVSAVHSWQGDAQWEELFDADDPRYFTFLKGPIEGKLKDEARVEEGIRFLQTRKDKSDPFMLFLGVGLPHCPYTCPEPFYSMYRPEDIPPLRSLEHADMPSFYSRIREYRGIEECGEDMFRRIMAVYLGMISYVDYLLGRVLDTLEESGLDQNTVFVAYSDHGDWAGDYGLVEKWPSGLTDTLTRIPMIVRTPDCKAGHVVHEPVESFDIMPTTLELAGIEPQHQHFARSMVPQLQGAAGDPDRAVFAEGGYDHHEPHCFEGQEGLLNNPKNLYYPKVALQQHEPSSVCRATMVRTQNYKLIRRVYDKSELYDLHADPEETNNLYDKPEAADVQRELEQRMLEWYIHTAGVTPVTQDPRGFYDESVPRPGPED